MVSWHHDDEQNLDPSVLLFWLLLCRRHNAGSNRHAYRVDGSDKSNQERGTFDPTLFLFSLRRNEP